MNDLPDSLKGIVKGGGSLTALPLSKLKQVTFLHISQQISITDGQIFLMEICLTLGFVQQLT
jgi:F-type H+-transporting ATPase subunit alpha